MDNNSRPSVRLEVASTSDGNSSSNGVTNLQFDRSLEGRKERRLPIAIVVHVEPSREGSTNGKERTFTDNVSVHGARVICDHSWEPGDEAQVTSVKDGIPIRGKVVYCQKLENGRFCLGLNFQEQQVPWSSFNRYSGI